ncbi:MAG: hypothetical protein ACRD0A_16720 [Acidimicrobiales bacterium]
MDADAAQLSSVATALDDLTARVVEAADRLRRRDDNVAADLDEVERALRAASRRLATTVRTLERNRH